MLHPHRLITINWWSFIDGRIQRCPVDVKPTCPVGEREFAALDVTGHIAQGAGRKAGLRQVHQRLFYRFSRLRLTRWRRGRRHDELAENRHASMPMEPGRHARRSCRHRHRHRRHHPRRVGRCVHRVGGGSVSARAAAARC